MTVTLFNSLEIKPHPEISQALEEFKEYVALFNSSKTIPPEVLDFYKTVLEGEIPEELPYFLSDSSNFTNYALASGLHTRLNDAGFYARITKKVARDLAKEISDKIVLDPLAGKGYGAKALQEAGVKVIASDNNSWEISSEIENLDALDSLRKYGNQIGYLLISWAPWGSTIDLELLKEIRKKFPHVLIINIGEYNGCTGSQEFMEEATFLNFNHEIHYRNIYSLSDFVSLIK